MTFNASEKRANAAMEKYGDNHWWDADERTFAYYQLREPIFLRHNMSISAYMAAVSDLVGRPVDVWEMKYGFDQLLEESQAAWEGRPWPAERVQEVVEEKLTAMITEMAAGGRLHVIALDE